LNFNLRTSEAGKMSETKRIKSLLRRAYQGTAWHGPSVCEVLEGVTAAQAAAHPIPGAHSIWEIVLHIAVWERAANKRANEWKVVNVSDEEDWPAVTDTSDTAWAAALEELEVTNRTLRETIETLDDSALDRMVEGAPYNAYFMLHGAIQHDLYHAGQIALLKKALPKP
jgi:uncharacterized damage-inducible protein DinB